MNTGGDSALEVCVALAALGPGPSLDRYIAASHRLIARALDASGGYISLGVRRWVADGDPLDGWRMVTFYAVGPRASDEARAVEQELKEAAYIHDPVVRAVVRDAGRPRVYHDPDPRHDPSRAGSVDARFWALLGLVDRLKLVRTVSADVEIHMSIDRSHGAQRFTGGDVSLATTIVMGLGPWARRLALVHGYLEGQSALSQREREIACALLGEEPLKQVTDRLRISEARGRELVRAVYRKLGVGSRAELWSAWCGGPAEEIAGDPVSRADRRHPR